VPGLVGEGEEHVVDDVRQRKKLFGGAVHDRPTGQ
jgi:hypothetical protein